MEARLIRAMQFYHLSRRGGALIASVILVKWGLSSNEIGVFETWMYLLMLSSFFWVESLVKAFLSIYGEYSSHDRSGASLYFWFSGIALAIVLLFALAEGPITYLFSGGQRIEYYREFLCYLMLVPGMAVLPFYHQIKEEVVHIWVLGFYVLLIYPGIILYCLSTGLGLQGVIYGLIIYAIVGHLWAWAIMLRRSLFKWWDAKLISRIWTIGWPLMLYAVIQSLTLVVDSALVQWYYQDLGQFAIFRYGARELPLVVPLIAGVVNLAIPALVQNWDKGMDLIVKHSQRLMNYLFPVVILLIFTSPYLFEYFYSPEFIPSASVFNIYLLLIIPQMLFPQTLITARRENRLLVLVGVVEVGFNVAMTYALIHSMQMEGVAWATFMAFCLEKTILMLYVNKVYGISWKAYSAWKTWLTWSVIAILATVLATGII